MEGVGTGETEEVDRLSGAALAWPCGRARLSPPRAVARLAKAVCFFLFRAVSAVSCRFSLTVSLLPAEAVGQPRPHHLSYG